MSTPSGLWSIWTDSWTIQDHYRDVTVGDHVEFAVEFSLRGPLSKADAGQPVGASRLDDDAYDLQGRVAFAGDNYAVGLDIGFVAGSVMDLPAGLSVGDLVNGTGVLTTADHLLVVAGDRPAEAPLRWWKRATPATRGISFPLVHTWEVQGIRLESAPYARVSEKEWEHDGSNLVPVEQTTAENAGMETIEWVLDCALLPEPPSRMVLD